MAIAIIKDGNKILLRKVDPVRNPYNEPWALFGSRIDGEGAVDELINVELGECWDMNVTPVNKNERLEWVGISDLSNYSINPPSTVVLKKLNYL